VQTKRESQNPGIAGSQDHWSHADRDFADVIPRHSPAAARVSSWNLAWSDPGASGQRRGDARVSGPAALSPSSVLLALCMTAQHHPAPAASSTVAPPAAGAKPSDTSKPKSSGARTAVLITGASLTGIAAVAGVVFTLQGDAPEDDWKVRFDPIEPGACRPSPARPPTLWRLARGGRGSRRRQEPRDGLIRRGRRFGAATAAAYLLWPSTRPRRPLAQGSGRRLSSRAAIAECRSGWISG